MKLQQPHYDNVKEGYKIYEIRPNDDKRQQMKIGDTIVIYNNDDDSSSYQVVITDKHYFKDFKDAIEGSELKKLLPNVNTVNEAIELYESFPNYIEKSEKYGIVRFTLNKK